MTAALPLTRRRFQGEDFSGQDFSKKDLSYSEFLSCNFDDCNLSEANCEGCNFTGSTFRRTNMYRTNACNAKFAGTVFEPRDAYGITLTFDCATWNGMKIGQLWWYAALTMWATTIPAPLPVKEPLQEKLIALIGPTRYVALKKMLRGRDL